MLHAFTDGMRRVAAAPAVLVGIIALVSFYGAAEDIRHWIGAVLLWAFLSGGVIDRYARRRATRGRGFFAACGAHFGAMLRLALILGLLVAVFHLAIGGDFPNQWVHKIAFVVALLLLLVLSFAQVRVAVEDRRSAFGALLAGGRFVARNPAALVLFAGFVIGAMSVLLGWERFAVRAVPPTWRSWTIDQLVVAIESLLSLAWLATAVSLFQARLAHAGYTAGPPLTWPESPAAEAIGNAAPVFRPQIEP